MCCVLIYLFGAQTNGDNAAVCVELERSVPPPAPVIKHTHTHTPRERSARTHSASHSLSLTPHKTQSPRSVPSAQLSSDLTQETWALPQRNIF